MLEAVSWFLIFFVTHLLDCIFFNKLVNKEKFKLSKKVVFILLLFSLIDIFVNEAYGEVAKMIICNINTIMILRVLYNKTMSKTLLYCIISYLVIAFSNVLGMSILNQLLKIPQENMMEMGLEFCFLNIVTFIIFIELMNMKKIKEKANSIMNWYEEKNIINTILLIILGSSYIAIIGYPILMDNCKKENLLGLILIFIGSIVFVSGFFKQRSENNELKARYKASNDYAKTYERMATTKAKELHEHENQLVTMRGLADKKNQKLIDYIDKAIHKVAETEDQDYNHKLVNIPDGGLKGLIGYKIDTMLSEKMEVYVRVSDKLSEVSLWKNLENNLRDISMILGIYIDNAIEAARESKNKYIVIEVMYEEEEIVFEISNTYQEEVEEVGREGYTTKGIGRGNGLTLVRDIIDKNDRVRDEREVVGSYYVQKLIYQPK